MGFLLTFIHTPWLLERLWDWNKVQFPSKTWFHLPLVSPLLLKFGNNYSRYRCLNVYVFALTNCFHYEIFFEVPLGSLRWMFFELYETMESLLHIKHSTEFHSAKDEQSWADCSDYVDSDTNILVFSLPSKEEVFHSGCTSSTTNSAYHTLEIRTH